MPRPKNREPNKSEFIRQHPELSTAELVAKARQAGLTVDPGLVYKVRGRSGSERAGGPRAADKKPRAAAVAEKPTATKRGRKPRGAGASASDFVRAQPVNVPVAQVVANGAAQGLKFSRALVYILRKQMGAGPAKAASGTVMKPSRGPRPSSRAMFAVGGADSQFLRLVAALGLDRSREVLAEVERKRATVRG